MYGKHDGVTANLVTGSVSDGPDKIGALSPCFPAAARFKISTSLFFSKFNPFQAVGSLDFCTNLLPMGILIRDP